MGLYDANSDRDHRDYLDGPHPERIERTCAVCKDVFLMVLDTDEDYTTSPLCEPCYADMKERNRQARAQQAAEGVTPPFRPARWPAESEDD